jgi:hypothetical protein
LGKVVGCLSPSGGEENESDFCRTPFSKLTVTSGIKNYIFAY